MAANPTGRQRSTRDPVNAPLLSSAVTGNLGGRVHHFERSVAQSGAMAERVAVRDITNEEGNRLLQIVRRGSGSVVRWRRAQIVL
jgi:hypothetical protein